MKTIRPFTLLVVCCALLLISVAAQAQDYMPLVIDGFPGARLSKSAPTGNASKNLEIAFYKIGVGGAVPLTKGDMQFIAGIRYENLRVDLMDEEGFLFLTPDNLHYLRADLYLLQRLSDQWTLGLAFRPGLASDFKEIGSDDLRLQGGLMVFRRTSPRLGYGFGAAFTSDFGTPSVVPLIKVDYQSASPFLFTAMLPVNAYFGYAFNTKSELGLTARISGTQYNLNVDHYDLLTPNAPDDIDLPAKYSVLTVGPTFKQRVRGSFAVVGEAGITLWRKFEFDGNEIDTTLDQDRSLYLRFGIAYQPPVKMF